MAFRYSVKCNCEKAECAGVATTEADAQRDMDWFEKRLGTDHAGHAVSRELYNPDALKEQLDAAIAERDALRSEIATYRKTLDEVSEIGTSAIDERDALRERCIEWLPFTEVAQDIFGSMLVWREDAGTFVAFYDDEQECWFSERGEDLTGDLPTFYAKMPQGPNE